MGYTLIQGIMELAELFCVQFYSVGQKGAGAKEGFLEGLGTNTKDFGIYVWIYSYDCDMFLYVYKWTEHELWNHKYTCYMKNKWKELMTYANRIKQLSE